MYVDPHMTGESTLSFVSKLGQHRRAQIQSPLVHSVFRHGHGLVSPLTAPPTLRAPSSSITTVRQHHRKMQPQNSLPLQSGFLVSTTQLHTCLTLFTATGRPVEPVVLPLVRPPQPPHPPRNPLSRYEEFSVKHAYFHPINLIGYAIRLYCCWIWPWWFGRC